MDGWGGGRGILSLSILFTTGCLRLGRGRKKGRGRGLDYVPFGCTCTCLP